MSVRPMNVPITVTEEESTQRASDDRSTSEAGYESLRPRMHPFTLSFVRSNNPFDKTRMESMYRVKRAEELLPVTRSAIRLVSLLVTLVSLLVVLVASSENLVRPLYIIIWVVDLVLWLYLVLLYVDEWTQEHIEVCNMVLSFGCNLLISWWGGFGAVVTFCDNWKEENSTTGDGLIESCDTYLGTANNSTLHFFLAFSLWFVFTSVGCTLLKMRYWHSLVSTLPPMLLALIGTMPHMLGESFFHNVFVVTASYLPALVVCTKAPRELEISHRRNFLLLRGKGLSIVRREKTIAEQHDQLSALEDVNRELESRLLPSSEEEKLFLPYREHLQQIVGESLLFMSEFTVVRKIGQGGNGLVVLMEWKRRGFENVKVAVKTLHQLKSRTRLEALLHEVENLDRLSHKKIVSFYGVFWPLNAFPSMVLEYVPNGSLRALLIGSDIDVSWSDPLMRIAIDVVEAMLYLHSIDYIHRDIKSENVLITRTYGAKIADLGEARLKAQDELMTQVGTPIYSAPEILLNKAYNESADIYSFGIMLNEMDTHTIPYSAAEEEGTHFNRVMVARGRLRPMVRSESSHLRKLVMECWCQDPSKRPSAAEVLNRLHGAHAWLFDVRKKSGSERLKLSGRTLDKMVQRQRQERLTL